MKRKAKLSRRIPSILLALVLLVTCFTVIMTSVSAADEIEVVGAMSTIKAEFDENYLAQATVRADDKYVGKIQYTAYYDTAKGAIKTGYEGTPIIIYTINHPSIERIGTYSDVDIIKDMLGKGYVVIVLDYLNNTKAVSPAIDNSSQQFRVDLREGRVIKSSSIFPSSVGYHENFLAPAGYNVLINQVFWEIDKHSAEGTLEKIVENWNSDFRATKGNNFVKWVHTDGTRKAVQNDLDGNTPVWYDANKKVDENGEYTYIKFTKAETVTDCIDPDGSFLDMNLYINIVYPTNPKNPVPVMSLANSSGYPTTSVTGADIRPHSNGFLYNGYANVVFDYLWQPMARNASWGYYDGSQGNTNDHMNYGLMMYNDKLVNTAAMRYLRYISLSGGSKYNFDLDAFGVYGNSKGGWFSFLGEKVLQSNLVDPTGKTTAELENAIDKVLSDFIPDRYYNGHHGETRYQVGAGSISADGFTVKAGEKQPWLTYNGTEILSGAQLTNACNGSQEEDITAGHSPIFISGNMTDTYNAAYSYSVNIYNMCRELNIPLLHFEVPIGHTLTSGIDMNYNVDTYEAYFKYVNYYLKNTPISVAYISPMNNAGNVKVTDKITVYFAGAVTSSEIEKITVSSADGTVSGKWKSSFGGTTWTFTPDALSGSTLYTVTVPADLKGDNGVAIGTAYTASFITELDNKKATSISGAYHTVNVPAFTTGNTFVFRFLVDNDAVNVAELYAVSAAGEIDGEYLGSVKVNGFGTYEIDITEFAAANAGKDVVLYLKTAKTEGNYNIFTNENGEYDPFDTWKPTKSVVTFGYGATIDGETTLKAAITSPVNKSNISYYYDNVTSIFTYSNIVGSSNVSANAGKRFVISFDVYDTTSRRVQVKLTSMTNRVDYGTIDYDHVIFTVDTKANEWTHVEFTYNPYETKYGTVSNNKTQSLAFYLSPDGDTKAPAYFNNLKSVEVITDVTVKSAVIAEKDNGTGIDYTPAISASPFAVYNGADKIGDYAGWKAALAAYKSGYTIKLQSDYTFTDADITNVIGNFDTVNVDFGSYTVTSANTKNSLIYAYANNTTNTVVNVTGGVILLDRTPLVSYESSTAAGSGKTFNINLTNTYIGFVDNAFATEIISAKTTSNGVLVNSNISFDGCTIELPDRNHAHDAFVIFANPTTSTLNVKYNLTGGAIKMTSQRWATISENANIVEFFTDDNGKYTSLIMPASNTYDVSGSYLNAEGYAVYKKDSVSNNMVTYTLETGSNSTRYGVITDKYIDASLYPFLVFKNGNLIGGYGDYKAAIDAASTALNGTVNVNSEAQILMRSNQSTTKEATLGSSAGTIVVDLNGFTLTRDKNPASMTVNSSTVFDYATGLLYKNGRIDMNHSYNSSKDTYSAGLLGATHVLSQTSKVKTFNVTYENVTFGFADGYYASLNSNGLLWAVWQNSYTSETITNLTLNDCIFDFTKNVPTGKNLITANGTYADFNIEINGGEIKGDASAYKLVITDAEDKFVLGKNAKGEYIKLADGALPTTDNFLCDDGVYRTFQATDSGYELKENMLVTKYGVIPEANGANTFVLFANGEFVSGHDTWAAATKAAGNYLNGKASAKAQLLMRKDYTNTNDACNSSALGNCNGELTIDLGGCTFTRAKLIFDFSYQTNTAPSYVVIKNGTLLSNGSAIFANQIGAGGTATDKVWNITVEDVTLGLAQGAGKSGEAFWSSWTNPTKVNGVADKTSVIHGSQTNVAFNDCIFDLQTVVPVDSTNLFDFSDNNGYDLMKTNLTINGGKILANNLAKISLFSVNSATSDKTSFGKLDGKYITMTTPTTAKDFAHATAAFNTADGTRYMVEVADDGTNSTYELLPMSFGNMSASITAKYLSAIDYPFFVFLGNTFKSANTSWRAAIDAAESHVDEVAEASNVATIILRRDYDIVKLKADGTNLDGGSNFNNVRGKIVLDLNGKTMNAVDTYLLDMGINYTSSTDSKYLGFSSYIEIKNGTLKNSRPSNLPMIGFQHYNTNDSYDNKEYNVVFSDVTFAFGSTVAKTIVDEFPDKTGDGLIINYTCNNCTFDFTGAATGSVIFDMKDNKTLMVSTLVINGGRIIADSLSSYTLYTANSNDTVKFGKVDGKYMSLAQLSTSAAPTATFTNANGSVLSFGKDSDDGTYAVYLLGEPIPTKYGDIPFMYQSVEKYPFVYFDEKGNFKYASEYFYGENKDNSIIARAKEYLKGNVWDGSSYGDSQKIAYVLMRRDYAMASNERFDNLAQIQGILTLDLNGYTFTMNDSRTMFPACIKPWSGSGDAKVFKSQIDVVNGTIKLSEKPIAVFSAWAASGTDVSSKQFVFNFTDVEFIASSKATSIFAGYETHSDTPTAIGNPEFIFNNCTFDLSNAKDGVVMFNLGNGYIHTNVTLLGGEIIAKNTSFVTFTKDENTTSSLMYGKAADGSYLSITLPLGVEAPADTYVTNDGIDCIFNKVSENGENVTYSLYPVAFIGYKIKTSVTLWSNFVYNIYIPTANFNKATVNGNAVTYNEVVIDGISYYHIKVDLPAGETLSDIQLCVTVNYGEKTLDAYWTLDVLNYTKTVMDGEFDDTTKTLMKDMLAYAASAHTYFKNTDGVTDKLSEIATILDGYNKEIPTGEAKKPLDKTYFTDVAVHLGEVPSFRFTLAEGYTAGDFTFKVGNRIATAKAENGYVEITMYAYMMLDDVTFTVTANGVTESYNLFAYYDFAKSQNDADLVSIVEALMKYSVSAKAYRNSVINN